MNYDALATMANLEKYLGYPLAGRSGGTAQLRKRPAPEALRKPAAEASKKTAADKGKVKVKVGGPLKKSDVEKGKRKIGKTFQWTPAAARIPTPTPTLDPTSL